MTWIGLQYVSVVFPDRTHLLLVKKTVQTLMKSGSSLFAKYPFIIKGFPSLSELWNDTLSRFGYLPMRGSRKFCQRVFRWRADNGPPLNAGLVAL